MVLFITHFIDEIMNFSDDVTVLRSGKHIATDKIAAFTPETIVRAMIGTDSIRSSPRKRSQSATSRFVSRD